MRRFSPFPLPVRHWCQLVAISVSLLGGLPLMAQEICDNAIDDDNDGLIDLNDPDCACAVIEPVSLIPNPSFEDLNCCPDSRSQLGCADVWIQASEPTTDLIHDCGWQGWPDYPPPRPFPDGDGVLGFRDGRPAAMNENNPSPNWKEYAGACLLSPLIAGDTYRFEFEVGFVNQLYSPSINITFYGTTDCANLPFGIGNVQLGCPTNGPNWVRLGSTGVNGGSGNQWVKSIIDVTPTADITAIAIGPPCAQVTSAVGPYYFFDNLILADFESFTFRVTGTENPCSDDFRLSVPPRNGVNFQWYRDGVALLGEIEAALIQRPIDGRYEVVIDDGTDCRISSAFNYRQPFDETFPTATICEEDTYSLGGRVLTVSGNYRDTLKSVANCDSIVNLDLTVLGEVSDTTTVKIFTGEQYEVGDYKVQQAGVYPLSLTSSIGCDSALLLNLAYYQVYIPTAFSPNGDGFNDRFSVLGGPDLEEVVEQRIYDRWGNQLAAGKEWDGTSNKEPLAPGAYVYVIRLRMLDGREREFTGGVMLLR